MTQSESIAPSASEIVESGGLVRFGEHSFATADLQNYLNQAGFQLEVDGQFGRNTRAAVREFQKQHGLKQDGIVGPNTLAELKKATHRNFELRKTGDGSTVVQFGNDDDTVLVRKAEDGGIRMQANGQTTRFTPEEAEKLIFDLGDGVDAFEADPGLELNLRVRGGAGDDVIAGGRGEDVIEGGDGNDTLVGGAGDDELHGGTGDDALDGGKGLDLLQGEQGDDRLDAGEFEEGALREHLDGGDGRDHYEGNGYESRGWDY